MTSRDFAYWLQGFFEISGSNNLDPSMGDKSHQKLLNNIHQGSTNTIVTHTTSKDIWLALKENKDLEELIERVPDEFLNWVYQKIGELTVAYRTIERQVTKDYAYGAEIGKFYQGGDGSIYPAVSRKDTALYINTCMYPKLMFTLLDNNQISDQIWDMIKPPHEKAFSI